MRRAERPIWVTNAALGRGCGWCEDAAIVVWHGADVDQHLRAAGLLRIAEGSGARGDIVRRAARRGDVRRVRRGAYVGADHWTGIDDTQRHLLELHAAVAAMRTPAVVSHRSAAALWDLPVVGVAGDRVHLTFVGSSGADSRGSVVRHAVDEDVSEALVDGFRVTGAARTVVDLARAHGLLTGVVAGDAALHRGLVTVDQLRAEVEAARSGRGVRVARDVVAFVDGRSESAGESLSRVRMHELGLPAPDLQHVVRDRRGFVGRVDFWWEDARVVGEFDGRAKYGIEAGLRSAADRLWDEKVREDRVRGTGVSVARWTWADAWAGGPMATILHQAGVHRPAPVRRAQRS